MKSLVFLVCVLCAEAAHADELAPGPQHDVVGRVCTACHVAAQVTAQHKSAEEWNETVNRMISYGARLQNDDIDSVVAYLATNYGATK